MLERDTLCAGSTSKAAGGIRAQFSDELNIRMALENIRRFERFGDEIGVDIDFKQWGYLIMVGSGSLPQFRQALELQHRLGVPRAARSRGDRPHRPPTGDRRSGGGHLLPDRRLRHPESVGQGYAVPLCAGGHGWSRCEVTSVTVEEGGVTGVATTMGPISSSLVIIAAGVWSVDLAAVVGLHLPVTPEPRHVWLTEPGDPLPHELPLTIDFDTGFYSSEGQSLLFGADRSRWRNWRRWQPTAAGTGGSRDPPRLVGYYEMTPDHNAVIGAADEPSGLLYGTGFSGHGFQQAPVVGEYLACLALGLEPPLDLSPLGGTFRLGRRPPESYVI